MPEKLSAAEAQTALVAPRYSAEELRDNIDKGFDDPPNRETFHHSVRTNEMLRQAARDAETLAGWRLEDRRDRTERLLSAVDWGDLTDWCAGTWVMRPDWRTVILNALLPAPPAAKEADRG
jgi:hypothetical protein